MRTLLAALLAAGLAGAASAQVAPVPGMDDPRLQTVAYEGSRPVRVVAFPGANLTVMLLPGEQVQRVTLSDGSMFEVRVTSSNDSLNIRPLRPDAAATLVVESRLRRYAFELATGSGLAAAYVVRFIDGDEPDELPPSSEPPLLTGAYRLSGERALRPASVGDDGLRTYIAFGEYQALPAVFGIGPTGEEEVVDGYMRDGVFTIDRVYGELVFRIDSKRAKARRMEGAGEG
jgi:type IV secretion system protein VirB9